MPHPSRNGACAAYPATCSPLRSAASAMALKSTCAVMSDSPGQWNGSVVDAMAVVRRPACPGRAAGGSTRQRGTRNRRRAARRRRAAGRVPRPIASAAALISLRSRRSPENVRWRGSPSHAGAGAVRPTPARRCARPRSQRRARSSARRGGRRRGRRDRIEHLVGDDRAVHRRRQRRRPVERHAQRGRRRARAEQLLLLRLQLRAYLDDAIARRHARRGRRAPATGRPRAGRCPRPVRRSRAARVAARIASTCVGERTAEERRHLRRGREVAAGPSLARPPRSSRGPGAYSAIRM
jgi:hypothetical protein